MKRAMLILLIVIAGTACNDDNGEPIDRTTTTGGGNAAPLVADFSYEIRLETPEGSDFCSPAGVDLADESTGDPTEWRWEFDDGEVLTDQNPGRDHVTYGEEVTLTVTRGDESDSATQVLDGPVC